MSTGEVITIAEKWLELLPFPEYYRDLFCKMTENEQDILPINICDYNFLENGYSPAQTLILYLYFCEELSRGYKKLGIPDAVLLDTLGDVVLCAEKFWKNNGILGIDAAEWLMQHFTLKLFRLGRLQFAISNMPVDVPERGINKGENVIDVHIPAGSSLNVEECLLDIEKAEKFFALYFPNYRYRYFTCFSWLMDDTLREFLDDNSNILRFQTLFEPVYKRPQDSILHFVFKFGIKSREELITCEAKSGFAKKIKKQALAGKIFYNVLAIRKKSS